MGRQVITIQHPPTKDPEAWKAQDQEWRRKPEIDADLQKFLTERRKSIP